VADTSARGAYRFGPFQLDTRERRLSRGCDVIPLRPIARALCSLEMFVGVIYLAAVVSRLIGLTLLRRE